MVDFLFKTGERYSITVKANARKNSIDIQGNDIVVFTTAPALDNKANDAVKKLFKKQLGLKIDILNGLKNRHKVICVM